MNITITKNFSKKFKKKKDKKLAKAILSVINEVKIAETINDIKNLKKLSGRDFAYRIRISKYRIGVFINDNTVEFANFDHRSKIYKIFP